MGRVRTRQGVIEIGLAALVCVLAAGVVIGSGFAQTVLSTPDPLTWLRNLSGELTQVNPETGSAVTRVEVGDPGDRLYVTQGDGVLLVTDRLTNTVTTIDVSMLRIGGVRPSTGPVKVLLTQGQVYLAKLAEGVVERIDAFSAATVGRPWRSDGPLTAVAADGAGSVWALGNQGRLTGLRWVADAGTLVEQQRRELNGAGADGVLAAHEQGVTALYPNGTVTRVGTGRDRTVRAPDLTPPLVPAERSPAALVPVSTPESSRLHLVRDNDVVSVDTAALGCGEPGQAAVYRGKVYAPCHGDHKVLVLDADGKRARADLVTAAGAGPELVVNADVLFVNVPDAATGLAVLPDGSVKQINTHDPRIPVVDPSARPTAVPDQMRNRPTPPDRPVPSATSRTRTPGPTTPGATATGRPTAGPGSPTATRSTSASGPPTGTATLPAPTTRPAPTQPPPTTRPAPTQGPRPEDLTPTGVTAQANPDNSVTVRWTPAPIRPTSYRILRTDTGEQVQTATADATFAIVTGLPAGLTTSFIVEAVAVAGSFRSQPSNVVSAYGRPGGPTVTIQLAARGPTTMTLRVTVDEVDNGGSPITVYDIEVSGGGRTLASQMDVPIGQRPFQVDLVCTGWADLCLSGGTVTAIGTLHNAAGAGPPTSTSATVDPPPPFDVNQNVPVALVSTGGKCLDRDLRLHTCNGGASQLWTPRNTGVITSAVDGGCLAHNGGNTLSLTSGSNGECLNRHKNKRWRHQPNSGSQRVFQGEDRSVCIAVIGPVDGEGAPVNLETCRYNGQELWFLYKQQPGVPVTAFAPARSGGAAARPSSADAPIGAPVTALLLLPIVVGLVRRRGRRPRLGRGVIT